MVGEPLAELEFVVGGVLADVDHSAKHDLHTGIQRVARNLLPEWHGAHPDVDPGRLDGSAGALRRLDERRDRDGSSTGRSAVPTSAGGRRDTWRSIGQVRLARALAQRRGAGGSAGRGSRRSGRRPRNVLGNRVVAIGYDAIPVVSADMVPPAESAKFTRYLTVIKSATDRVAGISVTATAEFAGFARMLPTQGLTGPIVGEVSLPSPAVGRPRARGDPPQPADGVGGRLARTAEEPPRRPARCGDPVARGSRCSPRVHRRQWLG